MSLRFFKSTFLFLLITATACGNNSQRTSNPPAEKTAEPITAEVTQSLKLGAERTAYFLPFLEAKKVGLVGNQTSIIPMEAGNVHLVDTLLSLKVDLQKVFAPEHGFRGTADAGEAVEDGKDPRTGLPVISLYGNNKKPTAEPIAGS
jgi:uncharacterized protein YbbC (DUF1343 family)